MQITQNQQHARSFSNQVSCGCTEHRRIFFKDPLSHDAYLPEPLTFIQLSYTLRRHLRLKGNQFSKMIRHSRLVRKYPCSCTLSLLLIQKLDETLDRRTSFQHVISRTSKLQNAVRHPPLTRGVTSQQVS